MAHAPGHDEGLAADLPRLVHTRSRRRGLGRRDALSTLGGSVLLTLLAACSRDGSSATTTAPSPPPTPSPSPTPSPTHPPTASTAPANPSSPTTASAAPNTASNTVPSTVPDAPPSSVEPGQPIPAETAGPFPGDGTNGPNMLTESGVVRSDIRSSFGAASGIANGIILTTELTLVQAATGLPLPGAAVYLWMCDREGRYSLYSPGVTDQNYLRGVQVADDRGRLTFVSVFPGCYPGRWPHAHFQVFSDLASPSTGRDALVTTQLAYPTATCEEAYASPGYEASAVALRPLSVERDGVFRDGVDQQMTDVVGTPATGYTASLVVRL